MTPEEKARVEARFWAKVDRSGECWTWTGYIQTNGYAKFHLDGRPRWAHRVAWLLTHGPVPEGLLVCHHCDNPRCVRPDHLFLGTVQDNALDMVHKGRCGSWEGAPHLERGEARYNVRLNPERVREIRRRHAAGATLADLARAFQVNSGTIYNVVTRRRWKHVLDGEEVPRAA